MEFGQKMRRALVNVWPCLCPLARADSDALHFCSLKPLPLVLPLVLKNTDCLSIDISSEPPARIPHPEDLNGIYTRRLYMYMSLRPGASSSGLYDCRASFTDSTLQAIINAFQSSNVRVHLFATPITSTFDMPDPQKCEYFL